MLIVALVLAVIGLAALVTAVVTSNELVAWVCIAASVVGVILLIVDAIRERQNRRVDDAAPATAAADSVESSATAETTAYSETGETVDATYSTFDADYPDEGVVVDGPADDVSEAADIAEAADVPEAGDIPEADEAEELDEKPSGESGSR
ncbi:hypothetical protein ACTXG7_17380 [Mycolicibacterium sp. Dal123E01]|uniref:hypothetical protein n=1 Tax=Mycolicibacterium sp. Dal123E01 TaxID=3457578 RepID=UPI00403EC393